MKELDKITEKTEKSCTGCVSGAMVGGLGTFILAGLVFPLGAIAIPIAATAAVVGGTVGKHIDKKDS